MSSTSLGESAYRQLRSDIIACRLQPGARLTEKELSALTGFGSSPVREALTRLDHEGLIVTLPRKGYQVATLTIKKVLNLLECWEVLGPELVRLGVANASDAQLEKVRNNFRRIASLTSNVPRTAADFDGILEAAASAFSDLAASCDNEYIVALYERLSSELARVVIFIASHDQSILTLDDPSVWADTILPERAADAGAQVALAMITAMKDRVIRVMSTFPEVLDTEVSGPVDARAR
jgi:DNA-binding GntR family transcriptional regulator